MGKNNSTTQRYRFSVPEKDTDVVAWLEEQSDLSISLRILIKNFVKKEGVVDIICRPVDGPKPQASLPKEPKAIPKPAPAKTLPSYQQTVPIPAPKTIPKPQQQMPNTGSDGFVDPESFFNL